MKKVKKFIIVSITRPDYDQLPIIKGFKNIKLLFPCGLEPGLTEIPASYLLKKHPTIKTLSIYCGGLPTQATSPLYYSKLFGQHVPTLVLLLDYDEMLSRGQLLLKQTRKCFAQAQPFFSDKTNNLSYIMREFVKLGLGTEVASLEEPNISATGWNRQKRHYL